MNIEQRDHLLTLIDNDTHLRLRYVSVSHGIPQYCIIGCMLAASGVDVIAEFINQKFDWGKEKLVKNTISIDQLNHIDQLSEYFGLTPYQIRQLQKTNDKHSLRKKRQHELKKYVQEIGIG